MAEAPELLVKVRLELPRGVCPVCQGKKTIERLSYSTPHVYLEETCRTCKGSGTLRLGEWVCWAEQGRQLVDSDVDLEVLLTRLGRPFEKWSLWGDTGGHPGLALISSVAGVQWTIRME